MNGATHEQKRNKEDEKHENFGRNPAGWFSGI